MFNKPRTIQLHLNGLNKTPGSRVIVSHSLGHEIKPFISLDVTRAGDLTSPEALLMAPDSGTAIITFLLSGKATFSDSTQKKGMLNKHDVLWILSGSGIQYSLTPKTRDCVSVRLRVALSPALENASAQSVFLTSNLVEHHGPAQVLLGRYKEAQSGFALPALVNYLVVRLSAGQQWVYEPPINHRAAWISVIDGKIKTGNTSVSANELSIYDNSNKSINFLAEEDSVFLLGSSQEYMHELASEIFSMPNLNQASNKNNSATSKAYALS